MVDLARGQLAHSLRHLADCWGWSVKRVRGFLRALEEDAMIATATDPGVTVITICKYNEYQRVSRPKGTDADTQGDTAPHTPALTARAHEGHNKEDREDKEIISPSLRSGDSAPAKRAPRTRARTQLADLWQIDEQDLEYASSRGFDGTKIREMANAFSNHHRSKGSLMADWHAAWRTWVENEIKFSKERSANGRRTVHDAARDLHENLLDRIAAFDEPAPRGLRHGTGQDVVRLLPARGRE
ncbi:hypothetical protein CWO90_03185 [Bradyrhizobium sp. Leo121]|nr:hypothetical protein CWO90_03185 [Bradyrhizobium sp. Leo121]